MNKVDYAFCPALCVGSWIAVALDALTVRYPANEECKHHIRAIALR